VASEEWFRVVGKDGMRWEKSEGTKQERTAFWLGGIRDRRLKADGNEVEMGDRKCWGAGGRSNRENKFVNFKGGCICHCVEFSF